MDFALNEAQQAVKELSERLCADLATHEAMRELELNRDARGPFDERLWGELSSAGLLGLEVSEAAGGAGLDFVATCEVLRQLGATAAYVPYAEQTQLAVFPISTYGTADQQAAWLPRLLDGSALGTAALSEVNGARVDLGITEPRTSATAVDGGYVLNGEKACVASGLRADLLLVPATLNGQVAVFLVEPATPGISVSTQHATYIEEALIVLDGVKVDSGALLGGVAGKGAEIVQAMQDRYTVALCAIEAGATAASLKLAAEYTKTREQFGKAIATFQAVGQRVADAYVDAEAISLTTLQASSRIAEGKEATKEIAAAKYWASEGADRVVHACVHVHGGVGVDRDYPLHRYFMLTRQLLVTLGGPTDQLRRIGAALAS
jgi:alkylation response protein AidB-like acyl-CoA dehydrogenase